MQNLNFGFMNNTYLNFKKMHWNYYVNRLGRSNLEDTLD